MLAVYYTNAGPSRKENQDAVLINDLVCACSETPQSLELKNGVVFAVADGIGSYKGGAEAASLLLNSLAGLKIDAPFDLPSLKVLCDQSSAKMRALIAKDFSLSNMSTTIAGIVLQERQMAVFNSGDCRVYRFSRPYLAKISHDHSVVQALFDSGVINEDHMRLHPQKNIVTAGVGPDADLTEIYFKTMPRAALNTFFLCSDGVWEAIPLERIEKILCDPPLTAAKNLVDELLEIPASDNISFIILNIKDF